jgi:flagellar biosynthesis protein FlhG
MRYTLRNFAPDQATGLRAMFAQAPGLSVMPVVATRRGMGFRSMVTNIAACYARLGQRVVVIDTGPAAAALSLGLRLPHDLATLLSGERKFNEVAIRAADGFYILNGQKGIPAFVELAGNPAELFLGFRRLADPFDVAILAGRVGEVAAMTSNQDDLIFITNPDADALTSTYAEIKRAHALHQQIAFRVLVNRVDNDHEGIAAFNRLAQATRRFLGVSVEYGGCITRDSAFAVADRAQRSVYNVEAAGIAAKQISQLVQSIPTWRLGRYAVNET